MVDTMSAMLQPNEESGTTTITLTNDEWAVVAASLVVVGVELKKKSYAVIASNIREAVTGHRIEGF